MAAYSRQQRMPPRVPFIRFPGPPAGSSCVPDKSRVAEQDKRRFQAARRAAPRLPPARLPPAKAIAKTQLPSHLRPGKRPAASAAIDDSTVRDPAPPEGEPSNATPARAPESAAVSLVAYGESDSEEEAGSDPASSNQTQPQNLAPG